MLGLILPKLGCQAPKPCSTQVDQYTQSGWTLKCDLLYLGTTRSYPRSIEQGSK
ncbi:hypothetical protein BDV33DRAFT_176643 [Aspergillus novoparasiticus]|uniref:Uncharacterized protein n=1 Tax=Aspergillus novoparasiticus TaxID=986946 RepID=A0A5N6EKM0_9EURO|nr:hypothetical protein BDV33DRAFT_176643 [Aspergillus novoparasiticus]